MPGNTTTLGFTDHSQAHCTEVAHQAGKILGTTVNGRKVLKKVKKEDCTA